LTNSGDFFDERHHKITIPYLGIRAGTILAWISVKKNCCESYEVKMKKSYEVKMKRKCE